MTLADFLAALQQEAGTSEKPLPPVENWNPERCNVADMEILADGTWRHEGSPIGREAMVRLFARILRRDEDGRYWLVTPAEKVEVRVADAPFVAIRADRHGEGRESLLVFTTNVGDVVALDAEHPLRVETTANGEPRPYLRVRGRLDARLSRAVWAEIAAGATEHAGRLGLWSAGRFWDLG